MPHQIARNFAFGPSALNDLAQAFDIAWLETRTWGVEGNTDEQISASRLSSRSGSWNTLGKANRTWST